jgi:hypothetical protein
MVGLDFTVLMPLKNKDEAAQHPKGKHKIRAAAAEPELIAIGKLCADAARRRVRKHGALLYDKRGLPR